MVDSRLEYLEAFQTAHPELGEELEKLKDFYQKKLWHQLTLALERIIEDAAFRKPGSQDLQNFWDNFIVKLIYHMSPMRVARLAVSVSKQCEDHVLAVKNLEETVGLLKNTQFLWTEQSKIFLHLQIAQIKLKEDDELGCKKLLDDLLEQLEALFDVDSEVWAAYHLNCSLLHFKQKNFAEFYKSSLLYLCYVQLDDLPEKTKQSLAVDISFSALLGEDIYNFGELLLHPLIRVLEGTSGAWLLSMLEAFNNGDIHKYDELCVKHADTLNNLPQMVEHEQSLRQKITILALTELIFKLPPDQRTIPFSKIADRTKLDKDGVEFLLMKTLSLNLIKGHIDEVDQSVEILWVQPRVLTKPQISALNERLGDWISKVDTATRTLESESLAIAV